MAIYVGNKRYAPYIGDKRRSYMGDGGGGRFTLLHHWSSEDNLIDLHWIDRVSELPWTVNGNITKNSNGAYVCSTSAYFSMAMNNALALPERYLIEVDCAVINRGYFIDFGSVTSATHAFGFGIVDVSSLNNKFTDNFKPTNNTSDINRYGVVGNRNRPSMPISERITFKYGCKKYDANNDIQYLIYDNIEYLAPNAHSHISFNGNWDKSTAYIGRCTTQSYNAGCHIYDLKIYQDNG